MKKKLFTAGLMSVLALVLISCGGVLAVKFNVDINILDENGKPVSQNIFENLECSFTKNEADVGVDKRNIYEDGKIIGRIFKICYLLGIARSHYAASGKAALCFDVMRKTGIKITDKSNTYQDIVMNPLPFKNYTVKEMDGSYPSHIEYTVQLKKK